MSGPGAPGLAGSRARRASAVLVLLCLLVGIGCGVYGKPVRSSTPAAASTATDGPGDPERADGEED